MQDQENTNPTPKVPPIISSSGNGATLGKLGLLFSIVSVGALCSMILLKPG